MFGTILSWLTGGGIAAIGKQLNDAYAAKLRGTTDHEKLEADRRIAELQAQQAVLLAEQKHWATRWIRPAFALPFIVYNAKVYIWDMSLGLGVTPDLSTNQYAVMGAVMSAYFLTRPFEKR